MKSELGLENVARNITRSISETLNRTGIMYRIFYRVKTNKSIDRKVIAKNYLQEGKKITDLIGIRLTLYFQDDVNLVQEKFMKEINYDHISKDEVKIDEFKPVRCNLTFKFLDDHADMVKKIIDNDHEFIDAKYEVQLRTVLSEGWHEVEHDLRYKCVSDWENHDDLSRNMNGILASLETSEFSMLQLFSELAHRHYKDNNIEAMIKCQFRIRFVDFVIDPSLKEYISRNSSVLKKIHRVSRVKILESLIASKFALPMTINHFIYLLNHLFLKDQEITRIAGEFITDEISASF